MDNSKYDEVIERLFYEQPEEVRNKKFGLDLLKPLPGAQTLLMANRGCGKIKLMLEACESFMSDCYVRSNAITSPKLIISKDMPVVSDDFYDNLRYAAQPCFDAEELKSMTSRFSRLVIEGHWEIPSPSGKKAWEPAKWQGGTDHTAPLKHGKDPKAVAKRRKKKKLASKR